MARGKKRRRRQLTSTNIKVHSYNNDIKKKPFRFFTIILPHILHQQRLRIPDEFSKKFGPEFSKVVTLTIPTGLSWDVAISQIENKLYFAQGWVDFMEAIDIRYGYFLEFGYCGNNHFEVYIFNLTCSQIDYPKEYDCYIIKQTDFQKEEYVKVKEIHSADRIRRSTRENPSFTVTLRKYFKCFCHIPKSFLEEHLNRSSLGFVKLQMGMNGKAWRVGCYHYTQGIRLTAGWGRFVDDNQWGEGESYTFVLAAKKRTSVVFNVFKEQAVA